MILFINPLNSFLTKSSKTASLVYFGVELIPTPESNKSLQVSGLYYSRLLSFIKYYIDEAITEMEAPEAVPHTEEIAEPYSNNSEPKIEADGVESVETESTPQKPEIVNTEALEVVEAGETETDEVEDWPFSDDVEPTSNNSSELSTLEKLLTEPLPQQDSEPTALYMANNTFTGLVSAPKLPTGSETGSPPDSSQLKPNVADITDEPIQLELLQPESAPTLKTILHSEEVEATTPLLEAVKTELIKINPYLKYKTCKYNPEGSTFLEIYHGDSHLGYFEDDGDCLWDSVKKLKFHGFSEEQLDAISEIELPKG